MTFKKGDPKPPGSGRKKKILIEKPDPTKYLNVKEFLIEKKIPLLGLWVNAIIQIQDPFDRAIAAERLYRFVEAPKKQKETADLVVNSEQGFSFEASKMLLEMENSFDLKNIISLVDTKKSDEK